MGCSFIDAELTDGSDDHWSEPEKWPEQNERWTEFRYAFVFKSYDDLNLMMLTWNYIKCYILAIL